VTFLVVFGALLLALIALALVVVAAVASVDYAAVRLTGRPLLPDTARPGCAA
jgi:hypothetical protein